MGNFARIKRAHKRNRRLILPDNILKNIGTISTIQRNRHDFSLKFSRTHIQNKTLSRLPESVHIHKFVRTDLLALGDSAPAYSQSTGPALADADISPARGTEERIAVLTVTSKSSTLHSFNSAPFSSAAIRAVSHASEL